MAGTGRPGVEPLSEQRAEFVRLIAQGVSNTEACRTLGVNRRTGTRWRFGRSVPNPRGGVREYPPVITKPVVVLSPRFLSENERAVIAHEHDRGTRVRATAMLLGRSPSTVSRELRRNSDPAGYISAGPRAPARPGQAPSAPATAARLRWGAAGVRPAASGRAVEPGADRGHPAPRVARRPTPSARAGRWWLLVQIDPLGVDTVGHERVDLAVEVLLGGRDARVAQLHAEHRTASPARTRLPAPGCGTNLWDATRRSPATIDRQAAGRSTSWEVERRSCAV